MHSAHGLEVAVVALGVGRGELRLRIERLDNAHAQERLFQHGHELTEFFLAFLGVALQSLGPTADQPTGQGQQDKGKQSQLPAQGQQRSQTHKDEQGRFQEGLQRPNDGVLNFHQVVGESAHDVASLRFGEPPHGHPKKLLVQVLTKVPADAGSDARHDIQRRVVHCVFQHRKSHHGHAQCAEGVGSAVGLDEGVKRMADSRNDPFLSFYLHGCGGPKEDAQKRHDRQKGEEIQHRAQGMQDPHEHHASALVPDQRKQGPNGLHPRTSLEANPR